MRVLQILCLCLTQASLRGGFEAEQDPTLAATTAAPTVAAMSAVVLEAIQAKIESIDAAVASLQVHVDTTAQTVFKSEMMAQNNRLNITGELAHLYMAGSGVSRNGQTLALVSDEAASVDVTIGNRNTEVANLKARVDNASSVVDGLIAPPDGPMSPEAKANVAEKAEEAEKAAALADVMPEYINRTIADNATLATVKKELDSEVQRALATVLRPEVDQLRDGIRALAKSSGKEPFVVIPAEDEE